MTIDEAIAYTREKAKDEKIKYNECPTRMLYCCEMCFHEPKCNEVAEYHEQLAKWLEELKAYREIGTVEGYKSAIECYTEEYTRRKSNEQYNKAIDDYNKEIKEYLRKFTIHYVSDNDFDYIAEQLKAGGVNE